MEEILPFQSRVSIFDYQITLIDINSQDLLILFERFQVKLAELQNKVYGKSERIRILKSLNKQNHEYLAFFVCRNPIDRLKSLYSYSLDLGRFKKGKKPKNFKDFIAKLSTNNSQPIISIRSQTLAKIPNFFLQIIIRCTVCVLLARDIMIPSSRWKVSQQMQS